MHESDNWTDKKTVFNGFVGRVPIFTHALDLFGYDLRVSQNPTEQKNEVAWKNLSEESVINASQGVKLEALVGSNPGFISVSDSFVSRIDDLTWPREQVILTLHNAAVSDDKQVSEIRELAEGGYTVAIDGGAQSLDVLRRLDFASICALDADMMYSDIKDHVPEMHGAGFRMLAKNIETPDQYLMFKELGFDYFQGEYFERPKLVGGTVIPANRIAVIDLLARLQDPDVKIDEIEDIVSQDITLSYKLLRLINAAYFGMPQRVESVKRATVFFGLERIKNWASVILFNAIDYKPRELLVTALVRARTCEILAQFLGLENPGSYYVAGMFSTLDAIMDAPMPSILERLQLVDEIRFALLEGSGPIGEMLTSILAVESGVYYESTRRFLDNGVAMHAYTDAIGWASEISKALAA